MNRTPEEIARQLNAIAANAQNIVSAVTSGAASPGGSITFRYVDRAGQTHTATGTAHNAISPGNVQALRQDDGAWIVLGTPTISSRESLHELRRRRPNEPTLGNIKVLYLAGIFGDGSGEIGVWVGGWKRQEIRLATYPFGTRIAQARINNLGGDRFIASWAYYTPTGETDIVTFENGTQYRFSDTEDGNTWIDSPLRVFEASSVVRFDFSIRNYGFGMWRYRNDVDDPGGNYTVSFQTGYWSKTETQAETGTRSQTISDSSGSIVATFNTEASEPIVPGRFERVFRSSSQVGNTVQIGAARDVAVGFVDQRLSQAYVRVFTRSLYGEWILGDSDRLLATPAVGSLLFEVPFLNWIPQGLFHVNTNETYRRRNEQGRSGTVPKEWIVDRYRFNSETKTVGNRRPQLIDVAQKNKTIKVKFDPPNSLVGNELGEIILSASYHPK